MSIPIHIREAHAQGLRIDPARHHLLPDSDYIRALRNRYALPFLFIYLHRETGNFVLAQWVDERKTTCTEIECWGGERVSDQAPDISSFEARFVPHHIRLKRMKDKAIADTLERQAAREERQSQKADMIHHYKRTGKHDELQALIVGMDNVGVDRELSKGGAEELNALQEDLMGGIAGKVYSLPKPSAPLPPMDNDFRIAVPQRRRT